MSDPSGWLLVAVEVLVPFLNTALMIWATRKKRPKRSSRVRRRSSWHVKVEFRSTDNRTDN